MTLVGVLRRLLAERRADRRSRSADLTRLGDSLDRLTFILARDAQARGVHVAPALLALSQTPRFLSAVVAMGDDVPAEQLEAEMREAARQTDVDLAQLEVLDDAERASGRVLSPEERDDLLQKMAEEAFAEEIQHGRPGGGTSAPFRRTTTRGGAVPFIP